MNNEFMAVATTFHALEELLRRQRNNGHPEVDAALITNYLHSFSYSQSFDFLSIIFANCPLIS